MATKMARVSVGLSVCLSVGVLRARQNIQHLHGLGHMTDTFTRTTTRT